MSYQKFVDKTLYNYPNRYDVIMARNCDTVGFAVIRQRNISSNAFLFSRQIIPTTVRISRSTAFTIVS